MVLRCKGLPHNTEDGESFRSSHEDTAGEVMMNQITVVLKLDLHCVGCMKKIKKFITKFKGVDSVSVDPGKDLVTVNGKMDAQELLAYLIEKLRRNVEVTTQMVPLQMDKTDKKEQETSTIDGEGEKEEEANGGSSGADDHEKEEVGGAGGDAKLELYDGYGYQYHIYPVESTQDYTRFVAAHVMRGPQLFSDENPNAYCSVM